MASSLTAKLRDKVAKHRDRVEGLDAAWIIEGKLLQMSTPGGSVHSFFRNPESEVLKFLLRNKVRHIIKLNKGERYDESLFEVNGITVSTINWKDHTAPTLEQCVLAVTFLWQVYRKSAAAIHCTAGLGRSGLVSAAFLYFIGEYDNIDDAMLHVRARRKGAVKREQQVQFLHDFVHFLGCNPALVRLMRAAVNMPCGNIEVVELYMRTLFERNKGHHVWQNTTALTHDVKLSWTDVYSREHMLSTALRSNWKTVSEQSPHLVEEYWLGDGVVRKPEELKEEFLGASETPFVLPMFGGPLKEQCNTFNEVPTLVGHLCRELLVFGPAPQLFTLFGTPKAVSKAQRWLLEKSRGLPVSHGESFRQAPAFAWLLVEWFRALPEPIIPRDVQWKALRSALDEQACMDVVRALPAPNRATLLHVVDLLSDLCLGNYFHNLHPAFMALTFAAPMFGFAGDTAPMGIDKAEPPLQDAAWLRNHDAYTRPKPGTFPTMHHPRDALARASAFVFHVLVTARRHKRMNGGSTRVRVTTK